MPLPFVSDSLAVLALVLVVLVVLVDFVAVAVEALAVLRVDPAALLPLGSVLLAPSESEETPLGRDTRLGFFLLSSVSSPSCT